MVPGTHGVATNWPRGSRGVTVGNTLWLSDREFLELIRPSKFQEALNRRRHVYVCLSPRLGCCCRDADGDDCCWGAMFLWLRLLLQGLHAFCGGQLDRDIANSIRARAFTGKGSRALSPQNLCTCHVHFFLGTVLVGIRSKTNAI